MARHSLILLCYYLTATATSLMADTHENVARFLPSDVAFYATLESPSQVIAELTSVVETELPTLEEVADLLLLTDLTDGSKRVIESSDLGVGVLDAESIHLVVFNSRTDIGPFAILIDKGEQKYEISEPLARLVFRFLAQVVNNGLPNSAYAGQLQEVMSKWESTLNVKTVGRWTIIASNDQLASDLANRVSGDQPTTKNLASNRRFQASLLTSLSNSFCDFYVSPSAARQIALSANFERETVWDKKKRDEIPWIASSIQLNAVGDSLVVDKKTVIAANVPLDGENKYWEFYRPIEEFPVLWDDVHTVLGKHVDLESWNGLAKQELDNVYGKGTYARYNDSPVAAFRTGLSRPKLGALSFSMMDSKNSKNLRLFKIGEDATPDVIMGYLNAYFPELQKNLAIGGYDVTYTKNAYKGLSGWWSRKIDGQGPPSEQGNGAFVLEDWVAIGSFEQLLEIADLDTGHIAVNKNSILHEKIMAVSERMGFEIAPHDFGFYRSSIVSAEMRSYATRILQRVFPNGWHVSQKSRERGLEDANVRKKMTRPQLLALYFTGMIDAYAKHDLEYIKVDSISTAKNRLEIGETFTLTKVNSNPGVPTQGNK